jgi:hypothetical protein
MNATGFKASVGTELFHAGLNDDGHPFVAEQYFVGIENQRGRRFVHQAIFKGTKQEWCEYSGDPHFPDLRESAKADAQRLCDRVNAAIAAGKEIDEQYWCEIDPAYGSDEYLSQGTEHKRWAAERAEAGIY